MDRRADLTRRRVQPGSVLLVVGILAVVVMLPTMNSYSLFVVALVGTQIIAALSLNVLMGYAGQVSLGQAAFVGVGAYAAAELAQWEPFPTPLIGAVLISSLVATVVGLPSLRIRGLQVAATTLAFGVAAGGVLFARPWSKNSAAGLALARPSALRGNEVFALAVWGVLALVVVIDLLLRRARLGRAFSAVRDREENAAAWGIPVGRTKLAAYAVSGAYAGTAGALYAYLLQRVTPGPFDVFASLGLVAAAVIGGRGSIAGVALAEAALTAAPELMRSLQIWAPLMGAVALAAVPTLRPEGLGWFLDRWVPVPERWIPSGIWARWSRRGAERAGAIEGYGTGVIGGDGIRAIAGYGAGANEGELAMALADSRMRPISLSMPTRTVLEIRDLRVRFGGLQALVGVNLRVGLHETVGLIGPNGAGKTTVFNCISGLVHPQVGSIRYRGIELLDLPAHARQGLGLARTFQQVGLCLPLSVRENVLIAQHPYASGEGLGALFPVAPPAGRRCDVRQRAEEVLALTGLRDVAEARVGDLPHVRQRWVELAAALASGPDLLLLDEPASGLSPEESSVFVDRLHTLREELGLTLLLIEHHLPVVTRLSDHVYVLAEGNVLAEGRPEEVQRDEAVIAVYLGSSPVRPKAPARGKAPGRGSSQTKVMSDAR